MPRGSLKWALWLFLIAMSFAVMEGYSLHENTSTFSRFIWNVSEAFRPFQGFVMFGAGFLTCHFWWGGRVSFRQPDIEEDDHEKRR